MQAQHAQNLAFVEVQVDVPEDRSVGLPLVQMDDPDFSSS
jgi:hypothetical protein